MTTINFEIFDGRQEFTIEEAAVFACGALELPLARDKSDEAQALRAYAQEMLDTMRTAMFAPEGRDAIEALQYTLDDAKDLLRNALERVAGPVGERFEKHVKGLEELDLDICNARHEGQFGEDEKTVALRLRPSRVVMRPNPFGGSPSEVVIVTRSDLRRWWEARKRYCGVEIPAFLLTAAERRELAYGAIDWKELFGLAADSIGEDRTNGKTTVALVEKALAQTAERRGRSPDGLAGATLRPKISGALSHLETVRPRAKKQQ